jgi:hypothetical protein
VAFQTRHATQKESTRERREGKLESTCTCVGGGEKILGMLISIFLYSPHSRFFRTGEMEEEEKEKKKPHALQKRKKTRVVMI